MRDWLGAKLLLSLTVCTPPVLLGGVALGLCLRLPAADTALTLLLPLAHALAMGALGLALNLRFPRLDWNQDVQAVKNGVSVLVTVLAGMLLPIGMAALAAKLGAPRIVAASCAALEAMIGAALFARLTRGRMPDVP